jgi:hypothetical protein
MAQTREVVCEFYQWEGGCTKGREGTFYDACQTCKKYKARRGYTPARQNRKRDKLAEIKDQDARRLIKEYL